MLDLHGWVGGGERRYGLDRDKGNKLSSKRKKRLMDMGADAVSHCYLKKKQIPIIRRSCPRFVGLAEENEWQDLM